MDASSSGGMVRVKQEPERATYRARVKEEAEFMDEEERVKEECSDSDDGCGVSEAAMLAGLYAEHEVKDELVLGPERPHRPTVGLVVRRVADGGFVTGAGFFARDCSVQLERLSTHATRGHQPRGTAGCETTTPPHTDSDIEQQIFVRPEKEQTSRVKEEAEFMDEEERVKEECSDSDDGCGVSEAAMLAGLYAEHEVKDELVLGPERPHRPAVGLVVRRVADGGFVTGAGFFARDCSVRLECLSSHATRGHQPRGTAGCETTTPPHTDSDIEQQIFVRPEKEQTSPAFASSAVSGGPGSCTVRLERLLPDAARRSCRVGRRTYKLRAAEPAAAASYQCHHCGERFTNKSVLKIHVHTHSPLHHSTVRDYGLERHHTLHGDKKQYKKAHVIIQIGEKPFGCNHCGYKSSSKLDLHAHLKTHTDEKPFRCSHCGYKFKKKAILRAHLKTHTDEKPFSCSHCGHKSKRKGDLQIHLITHTNAKPFWCSHCGYKCKTKGDLRKHLIIHTDEKPFRCSHCGHECKSKAILQQHLISHTDEKPFRCSHCGYKCKRKSDLKKHLITHTDEKPFRCSHCGYKFKKKSNFTCSFDDSHRRKAFQL
ncbi:gastrula zinc finger protein 5-1-like isoform X2 [Cydia pomonella]|uniref:gastrula zinc finger protein 5-1-like isoform X2 n=1 Tax=Cydia pomonella TaxID=82600 RepID=UPI002ADDA124|nr:gastrula zinc finger protein 5-1-like isoform X2 [Cydia pomonella]